MLPFNRLVMFAGVLAVMVVPHPAFAKGKGKTVVSGIVNLNTGTMQQLDMLPGVGEKAAKRIIDHRQKSPFSRPEELVKVKGFGKKKFERLKPFLATSGPSTIKASKSTGVPSAASIATTAPPKVSAPAR